MTATKRKHLEPSAEALKQARKLVSKRDRMRPTGEFSAEGSEDFGIYQIEEQEGWEQTDHFDILYRQEMIRFGYEDAYAQGFDEDDFSEPGLAFHEMFLEPLKEEFWEQWASTHKLYEFWKKNVKGKTPR